MKWCFLLCLFYSIQSYAVIFGVDDRQEIFKRPDLYNAVGKSVAMMVSPVFLKEQTDGYKMDFNLISDSLEVALCPEQKFSNQPTASVNCTGFLVAPDLLLTAGHCMTHVNVEVKNKATPQCSDFIWVFDYKYESEGQIQDVFPHENVFKCKEVVSAKFEFNQPVPGLPQNYADDYALVRLERNVPRPVLSSYAHTINKTDLLYTVGYPTGLPMKAAVNGKVKKTSFENFFTTTLDILGGNSGGPVFNQNHQILGLVVRAYPGADYEFNKKRDCSEIVKCSEGLKMCQFESDELDDVAYSHIQKIPQEIFSLIEQNLLMY